MTSAHQLEELYKGLAKELGLTYKEILDAMGAPIVADDFQFIVNRYRS